MTTEGGERPLTNCSRGKLDGPQACAAAFEAAPVNGEGRGSRTSRGSDSELAPPDAVGPKQTAANGASAPISGRMPEGGQGNARASRFLGLSPGAALMLGSAFSFSLMSVLVKWAGERLPSQQLVLARAVVTLVISYQILRSRGVSALGIQRKWLLLRGLLGTAGLSCFYYALTHLPLAEATLIHFTNPVLTAICAAVFLSEPLRLSLLGACTISTLGLILVMQPEFLFGQEADSLDPFAAFVALLGAAFSALAYTLVRYLSRVDDPLVIVFYFPLVAVPVSIVPCFRVALWPTATEWLMLAGIGVVTQIAQVWLTRGLQREPAGKAMSMTYIQVLFAVLWGMLLFGDTPSLPAIGGAVCLLLGTLAVAFGREASARKL